MDLDKVNSLKQQRKAVLETNYGNADINHYMLLQHDKDVIFYDKSLKEFIRLIQRQGINNLTIYSVGELLAGNKYETVLVRNPPANYEYPPQEFDLRELQDRKNYFVFVRYSFAWEEGFTEFLNDRGNPISKNEKNGRHVFVRTVNDILFYKKYNTPDDPSSGLNTNESSVFSEAYSEQNPLPSVFPENASYMKNGTFTVTIDNVQYVIKIKGFNDNGEYTGALKPANVTDATSKFLRGDGTWTNTLEGTFTSYHIYPRETNKYDLGSNTLAWRNLYLSGDALPTTNATVGTDNGSSLGSSAKRWKKLWVKDGDFSGNVNIGGSLTINNRTIAPNALPTSNGQTTQFWRGGGSNPASWTNVLTGPYESSYQSGSWVTSLSSSALTLTDKTTGYGGWVCGPTKNGRIAISTYPNSNDILYFGYNTRTEINKQTNAFARQMTWDGATGYFTATRVYNAVFNDYAECRTTIDLEPGRVVVDNDDGTLSCASQRLQPGAQVISDTFGNLMGETENAKTPIAVAGRVLVYTYQPRENYHAGMAVCSAPDGTVDIMTREEIRDYPDCIIGIVSEIPQYEKWGTEQVNVDGRIWIKVK